MAFFPPIPLIRRNHIIKKMRECNSASESTAKTFKEAGIINPNAFAGVTAMMLNKGILVKTKDGKSSIRKSNLQRYKMKTLKVTSPAFKLEEWIPNCCSGFGEDFSPEIHIDGIDSMASNIGNRTL